MKKNCIIIHGCTSVSDDTSYNKHRIPWTKKQLISHGIETKTPIMPYPWQPDYDKFKKEFEKLEVNHNTILIGHSCGCSFLVRWLWESKKIISQLILVAPWKVAIKWDIFRENFYNYQVNKEISKRVKKITMFTSNNEKIEWKESLKIFHDAIGGKIINLKNTWHYIEKHMWTEEFPELLNEII